MQTDVSLQFEAVNFQWCPKQIAKIQRHLGAFHLQACIFISENQAPIDTVNARDSIHRFATDIGRLCHELKTVNIIWFETEPEIIELPTYFTVNQDICKFSRYQLLVKHPQII